ncbi:hypothetical protein KBB68_02470 [Candidatus Babeliales bacterium]|nr:hypothetical protein [Candidatus Babeliales bacterium]
MQSINLLHYHAHLWIGSTQTIEQQIIIQLQKTLCSFGGCQTCTICTQIKNHEHPWTHWLQPDGAYNLDQIDEILETVRFKLDKHEQRFIIFTKAEELTASCNNRLLKTIEEPYPGYIFIFLATRNENILATLQSRCFLKEFDQHSNNFEYEEIMQPFLKNKFEKPAEFMKLIDSFEIKERETKDIVDSLIASFHAQLKNVNMLTPKHKHTMIKITDKIILLKEALLQLPPQGSAKMFWKNIYLKFHEQQ